MESRSDVEITGDATIDSNLDAGSSEPAFDDRGIEDADDDGVRTSDAMHPMQLRRSRYPMQLVMRQTAKPIR